MTHGRVAATLPDVGLAVGFLVTWLQPRWLGVDMLPYAVLTMAMEFIVIHSSAFMGAVALSNASRATRTARIVGLGVFYSVFVAGFSLIFRTWAPTIAFWSLTANRLATVLFHDEDEQARIGATWALSFLTYFIWVVVPLVLPLPRLGVTDAVLAEAAIPSEGAWVDAPEKALVSGAGYFLSQAYFDLRPPRWVKALKPV